MNNSFTWESWGAQPKTGGGVYLFVLRYTPKRVIYVGQTGNFKERIAQHRDAFLKGERTLWRAESNQDVYELMSHNGEKEPHKYYHSLAKKGLLWATADRNKEKPSNDLYPSDDFNKNWRDFVWNKYINNIEVWVCKTPNDEELRLRLESQIQNAIRTHYSIGSHIHHHVNDMCFLGKVELPDMTSGDPFTFTNTPEISEEFTQLLHNQLGKDAKKYLKPARVIKQAEAAEKKAAEAEKIKLAKETYKNAGESWKLHDDLDFQNMVKSNTPLSKLVERFSRPHDELVQRYITLVKGRAILPKLNLD